MDSHVRRYVFSRRGSFVPIEKSSEFQLNAISDQLFTCAESVAVLTATLSAHVNNRPLRRKSEFQLNAFSDRLITCAENVAVLTATLSTHVNNRPIIRF